MRSQRVISVVFVVALSLLPGCNSPDPDAPLSPPDKPAETAPPVQDAPSDPPTPESTSSDAAAPAVQATTSSDAPSDPPEILETPQTPQTPEDDMQRVKADVGVAKAGRSLDEYEGALVTPAKALFTVREKAVFQIQIPEALKLYKAVNGSAPKSHDEFMAKVIEANQIQLPELPQGQRYVYDPEQGELMVEKPRP